MAANGIPKSKIKFPEEYYSRLKTMIGNQKNGNSKFDPWFLCKLCKKVCVSNIDFANHLYAHFLHPTVDGKSFGESFTNHSRCSECGRIFENPCQMAIHYEQVHNKIKSLLNSVCYICELSFLDDSALEAHMRQSHTYGRDMPYDCKICRYKSSLYVDVWNHVCLEHNKTQTLMCPLCLMTMNAKIGIRVGTSKNANSILFAMHISRHSEVGREYGCSNCKLQFISQSDLNCHLKLAHQPLQYHSSVTDLDWQNSRPLTELESSGQQLVGRRSVHGLLSSIAFTIKDANCIECHQAMDNPRHYTKRSIICRRCSFTTCCIEAFKMHKTAVHKLPASFEMPFEYSIGRPRRGMVLTQIGYCMCGFKSLSGDRLAHHLACCSTSNGRIQFRAYNSSKERNRSCLSLSKLKILEAVKIQPRERKRKLNGDIRSGRMNVVLGFEKQDEPEPKNTLPNRFRLSSSDQTLMKKISDMDKEILSQNICKRFKMSSSALDPASAERCRQFDAKIKACSSKCDSVEKEGYRMVESKGKIKKVASSVLDRWSKTGGTKDDLEKGIIGAKKNLDQ